MDRERFKSLVARAVEALPEEFTERMENVFVVVEDYPDAGQLARAGLGRNQTLLGLYEGVPITRRGDNYNLVAPDKITIFQKPIESRCRSEDEITTEIHRVVRHEIAHHFGISDATLSRIERAKYKR